VAFSVDGKILGAQEGDTVRLWDIATGRPKRAAPLSGYLPTFSPDGKTLAVGSEAGTIWLLDLSTWQTVGTLTGHAAVWVERTAHGARPITGLAFSPDGQMLASAGGDLTVRLWNLTTRREVACLKGHTDSIWALSFAPDGKTVATCSRDGTVKLWNLTVGAEAATLKGHRGQVAALAFAPHGDLLATAGADGKIHLWRASPFSETDAPGRWRVLDRVEANAKREALDQVQLGLASVRQGNIKQAAAELALSLDVLLPGTGDWQYAAYQLAIVQAYLGEVEKYQALCRRTVRDFQQTTNVMLAERTAKMCFFAGLAQDSEILVQAGKLADFAIANIDETIAKVEAPEWLRAYVELDKGMVEYRRGNNRAALGWLQKSAPELSKTGNQSCHATVLFFSAMAAHRLGKTEEAGKWLGEAHLVGAAAGIDTDWLIMDLVRREAEALIEGQER
jgi:hypothetical protein